MKLNSDYTGDPAGRATPGPESAPQADPAAILAAIDLLARPDDVIEIRALHKGKKRTDAGYFDPAHRAEAAQKAAQMNRIGAAVYLVMNPINPALLSRYCNRYEPYAATTTADHDIQQRRWLLLDFDPKRPAGIGATEDQLQIAKARAESCREFLAEQGWPEPVVCESGNGIHLLYPLNLPNDAASKQLVELALKGLAGRFDDDGVLLDTSVFNAARITKLYGTVATKGDHTPLTPHRPSRIVSNPGRGNPITPEQLRALHPEQPAATAPTRQALPPRSGGPTVHHVFDLEGDFLPRLGIGYTKDLHQGRERFKLDHCPFNPEHGRGEAAIFRDSDGKLGFKCQHNSCADNGWREVRESVDGPRPGALLPSSPTAPQQHGEDGEVDSQGVSGLIESIPGHPATRARAGLIREALQTIPPEASLGGDEGKRPLMASTVIGRALRTEYRDAPIGRALCAEWDARTGGGAAAAFDRADPDYSKGRPLTADSVFRLAKDHGWTGPGTPEADAETYDPPALGGITPEELDAATLHPPCIVENYLFADLALLAAAGGTGKTTMLIHEAVCIALGRPVWGLATRKTGATLFITAEDPKTLFVARLREIMTTMNLHPVDRKRAMSRINVWDVSGDVKRLAEMDAGGNIRLTGLADAIADAYQDDPPVMLVFDPCVSFGPGERLVNDGDQAIVIACRRIIKRLGCCVRIVHHTGKGNARAGAVDQYASRGGSALPDGSRMVAVLSGVNEGDHGAPPEDFHLEPGESGFVLARAKLSYAPPQPKLWIKRTGYHFQHFVESGQNKGKNRDADADAEAIYAFLRTQLTAGRKHTKHTLEAIAPSFLDIPRAAVRTAMALLIVSGRVREEMLPPDERKGGRKNYINLAEWFGEVSGNSSNPRTPSNLAESTSPPIGNGEVGEVDSSPNHLPRRTAFGEVGEVGEVGEISPKERRWDFQKGCWADNGGGE